MEHIRNKAVSAQSFVENNSTDTCTGPGIWYTGGGVTHARFYSRFVALQIKADVEGTPLPVYKRKAAVVNAC